MNTFSRQAGRHRQRNTDVYNTILDITTHMVVELAQQMANSFMQWNKNSHHVDVDPAS